MNKHVLETRIKSIRHYKSEIERLREAIKVNESVIADIENSLLEFSSFKEGDILFKGEKIIKVTKIDKAISDSSEEGFKIRIEYRMQSREYGFGNSSYDTLHLSEWNKWKKIN